MWLNGMWISGPPNITSGEDSIYGYLIPAHVVTVAALKALTSPTLNVNAGYFNKSANLLFVYDRMTSDWVLYAPKVGNEFIDIDTGDVFNLRPVGGASSSSSASPSPSGAPAPTTKGI